MDKNLNSRPQVPIWLVLLQLSPLVVQLLDEFISRVYGNPSIISVDLHSVDKTKSIPLDPGVDFK